MPPRLYTLAEAEALLPELIPILEAIRQAHREVGEAQEEIERLTASIGANGHGLKVDRIAQARQRVQRASATLRQRALELDARGVELKDPATGLIDFRSRRQGRIVYLCWRLGEPRIDWWHELEAGFAGRQRLERDG
ncbi:MAG TPA: DUF2203 domain-containing protein [Chloroflexota bacterium]|jgi:hypothetical protein|nr:DUF2203 domain-containing protein [Chloroflexota bacterium]